MSGCSAKVAFPPIFNAGEIVLVAVKSFHPSEREHCNFFFVVAYRINLTLSILSCQARSRPKEGFKKREIRNAEEMVLSL